MRRPSFLMMLVVLLTGLLVVREPRFARMEEGFLRWLFHNSETRGEQVPLTVIEIGKDRLLEQEPDAASKKEADAFVRSGGSAVSPLEYALFLQAVLDFQPAVVGFENILRWRERDKAQEQVFLDQAMRVPKLLLGSVLTPTPDPDVLPPEISGFPNVKGRRGDLVEYSGVSRQPGEDLRLVSTPGYINLPEEVSDDLRIPLLFRYRGEVVPAFALQAIMMQLRLTPAEVKIDLDSRIEFPDGKKIPIRSDGTLLVNPNAKLRARRMTLNELLLSAQNRTKAGTTAAKLENLRDHIVLARTPRNPLSPPDVIGPTIATMQSQRFVQRVGTWFDILVILLAMIAPVVLRPFSRFAVVLSGIALTAAFCLIALGIFSQWLIWLPGYLTMGAAWLVILLHVLVPRKEGPESVDKPAETAAVTTG